MEEPNLADALRSADLKDQDQWEEEDQGEDQREDANMENLRDPLVVDDARSADAHLRGAQDADAHQSVDADLASTASSRTLPSADDARSADASHASHTSSVLTRTLTCTLK